MSTIDPTDSSFGLSSLSPTHRATRSSLQRVSTALSSSRTAREREAASSTAAERELRSQCEQLRKESERKDRKIEHLSKEMQQLRAMHTNQQRDLKLQAAQIEKLQSDCTSSGSSMLKLKEQNKSLSERVQTLSDSAKLVNKISQQQQLIEEQANEISALKGEVTLRNERISALTYELQVAERTLSIQSQYERTSSQNLSQSIGMNRELLRSLYFDLGKKSADNHSLALSITDLAEKERELQNALALQQRKYQVLSAEKTSLAQLLKEREQERDAALNENVALKDTERSLRAERDALASDKANLSKSLQESRSLCEDVKREKNERIQELMNRIASMEKERDTLLREKERLGIQVSDVQYEIRAKEERHLDEKDALIEEIARLRERDIEREMLEKELDLWKRECERLGVDGRKVSDRVQQLEKEQNESLSLSRFLQLQLRAMQGEKEREERDRLRAERERDEVTAALRQAMATTRSLVDRLKDSDQERERLQRELQTLVDTKASISAAILDALHRERQRNAQLVASLSFTAPPTPVVSSVPVLPVAPPVPPIPAASTVDQHALPHLPVEGALAKDSADAVAPILTALLPMFSESSHAEGRSINDLSSVFQQLQLSRQEIEEVKVENSLFPDRPPTEIVTKSSSMETFSTHEKEPAASIPISFIAPIPNAVVKESPREPAQVSDNVNVDLMMSLRGSHAIPEEEHKSERNSQVDINTPRSIDREPTFRESVVDELKKLQAELAMFSENLPPHDTSSDESLPRDHMKREESARKPTATWSEFPMRHDLSDESHVFADDQERRNEERERADSMESTDDSLDIIPFLTQRS